jgi:hypothetical protein
MHVVEEGRLAKSSKKNPRQELRILDMLERGKSINMQSVEFEDKEIEQP